jgi:hypothetical protein
MCEGASAANTGGVVRLLIALVLLLASGCATQSRGTDGDLLHGRAPVGSSLVDGAAKLTDGVVNTRGDDWSSSAAMLLRSSRAYVEYDLGRHVPLGAAYVQADANDFYTLSVSDDGTHFKTLWRARPVGEAGLQPRWAANLHGAGRYLRLEASGGDGRYSATELAVYAHAPAVFPPRFSVRNAAPAPELLRSATLVFGLALVLFLLIAAEGTQWWLSTLAAAMPIYAGVRWLFALDAAWPLAPREVSLVRGVVAAVAGVAVVREAFAPASWKANRRVVIGTLAVCGVLAAACFANLGTAQYVDHEHNAPGYVHNYDMRVYYPVAKYFNELSFDGLYDASVAAYIDDDPHVSVESLHNVALRDLRSHSMVHVSDVAPRIKTIKTRFSPARWHEFVADMRYFRLNMGTHDYLGSMADHGGNATPAWFAIAHLVFARTHASNGTLLATALLDPLLMLIAFIAIWRTFGVRTMLVALIVFGANDFYMFGTDWFGSTLRADWMAYLALGACALKTQRFKLAGGLIGMSAMMRAFPLLALVGAAIPALWWLVRETSRRRALPRWRDILREQRPIVEVAGGALVVAVGMLALSSIMFSPGAWVSWLQKVSVLDASPHLNHISLRGLVAGSGLAEARLLRERLPIFIAGILVFSTLVVVAAHRRPLHQAALLGLPLVPVLFNPANYYSHLIFLYPLLAVELSTRGERPLSRPVSRRDAGIWVLWLGVCAAQYGTVLVHDVGLHFDLATALLFLALATMLLMLVVPEADAVVVAGSGAAVVATAPSAPIAAEPGGATPEPPPAAAHPEPEPASAEPERAGVPAQLEARTDGSGSTGDC